MHEIRNVVREQSRGLQQWEYAKNLYAVYDGRLYLEWGYLSWSDYVNQEVLIGYRAVMFAIAVYDAYIKLGEDARTWLDGLGWWRAARIVHFLTDDNLDEWIEKVNSTPFYEFGHMLDPDRHERVCPVCGSLVDKDMWAGINDSMDEKSKEGSCVMNNDSMDEKSKDGTVIIITGTDEQLDRELGNVRPDLVIREEKPRGSNGAIATMKKARDLSISMNCPVIVALYPSKADRDPFGERDFPGSSVYLHEADIAIKMWDRRYEISKSRTIFIDHLMGN